MKTERMLADTMALRGDRRGYRPDPVATLAYYRSVARRRREERETLLARI